MTHSSKRTLITDISSLEHFWRLIDNRQPHWEGIITLKTYLDNILITIRETLRTASFCTYPTTMIKHNGIYHNHYSKDKQKYLYAYKKLWEHITKPC